MKLISLFLCLEKWKWTFLHVDCKLYFYAPGQKGPAYKQSAIFKVLVMVQLPNLDCEFM